MIKRVIFVGQGQEPDLIGVVQEDNGHTVTVMADGECDTYTHQELLTMARDGDVKLIRGVR